MSFTLRIAAAPVPGVRGAEVPEFVDAATAAIVTLEASGRLDEAGVESVAAELRRLFAEGADTVVVDVARLATSEATRDRFAAAIVAERALTHHVFVRSSDEPSHGALARCEGAAAWLMPLEGTASDVPRRNITGRSPLQP